MLSRSEGWDTVRPLEPVDALLLAQTLASRLCLDLSGQVNALTAATEVLRDDANRDPEVLDLAHAAGELLVRRLRLARAAWGPEGAPMAVAEWKRLAEGVARRGVTLRLDGVEEGEFDPHSVRLSLNVLLLAAESLPAGGVVEAVGEPRRDLLVRIHGARAAWPRGLAAMLADPEAAFAWLRDTGPEAAARSLQGPLTALISHAAGQRVSLLLGAHAEAAPPLLVELASRG
jgi:hypothetical protein